MSNHCLPEWGVIERDLDFNIFDSEEQPHRRESRVWVPGEGQSQKRNSASIFDDNFEELCWEDGELFVATPLLSNRPAAKPDVCSYETSDTFSPSIRLSTSNYARKSSMSHEFPSVHGSSTNLAPSDDDLLSWLEYIHTQDDKKSDSRSSDTGWNDRIPSTLKQINGISSTNEPASSHGVSPVLDKPKLTRHSSNSKLDASSSKSMNFASFSRAIATIQSDLSSLGINGQPSGVNRLRQLDRSRIIFSNEKDESDIAEKASTLKKEQPSICQSTVVSHTQPEYQDSVNVSKKSHENHVFEQVGSNIHGSTMLPAITDMSSTKLTTTGLTHEISVLSSCQTADPQNVAVFKFHDEEGSYSESVHLKSTSTVRLTGKRNRTAERHNLSERKRRHKIKEKMTALWESIPDANKSQKTDKSSILDEAIMCVRSLQQKVQDMAFREGMSRIWASHYPVQMQGPDWPGPLETDPGSGMQNVLHFAHNAAALPVMQQAPMPYPPFFPGMVCMQPPLPAPVQTAAVTNQGTQAYQMHPHLQHPFLRPTR